MRGLDLFSGIGLFSLGMEETGIKTVAACEIADWKRLIFSELTQCTTLYNDVRELTGQQVLDDAGQIDIVFGSPPCKAFSSANTNGRGILDDRLFFEAIRIIGEIRPGWFVLENSPSARTRGADGIIAAMEEEDYAVWPCVVGPGHFGAPHLRDRVWFFGLSRDATDPHGHRRQHAGGRGQRGDISAAGSVPANGQSLGRRSGRQGRSGAGGEGQPEQALQAAADATEGGRNGTSWDVSVGGQPWAETEIEGDRLAFWQSLAGDHGPQLAALERDIGPAIHEWAGGLGGYLRLADECPAKTARMLMSACGDGVVVEVAAAIGRAILQADRGLKEGQQNVRC